MPFEWRLFFFVVYLFHIEKCLCSAATIEEGERERENSIKKIGLAKLLLDRDFGGSADKLLK